MTDPIQYDFLPMATAPACLVSVRLPGGAIVDAVPDLFPVDGMGWCTRWKSMTESERVYATGWRKK